MIQRIFALILTLESLPLQAYKEVWVELHNYSTQSLHYRYVCSGDTRQGDSASVWVDLDRLVPQSASGTTGQGDIISGEIKTIKMNNNRGIWINGSPGCVLRMEDDPSTWAYLYFQNSGNLTYYFGRFGSHPVNWSVNLIYWSKIYSPGGDDWYWERPFKLAYDPYDHWTAGTYVGYGPYKLNLE